MIDEKEPEGLLAASAQQTHDDIDAPNERIICLKCSGPNHLAKDCRQGHLN